MHHTTNQVFIIGLGLIGSSLALGIKRDHPEVTTIGYDRSERTRTICLEKGIVDHVVDCLDEGLTNATVIFLAVPIKETVEMINYLAQADLREGVLITDTGSTKLEIVAAAEKELASRGISFIGGHPMAGSHKSGPLAADVNLFENAYYILTPTATTPVEELVFLKDLLSGLHARFIEIQAAEHDRVTSQISHFPHVLSASLMEQASHYAEGHGLTNQFAAGAFRDMTRIAESEPAMWTAILLSNQEAILDRIRDFQARLDRIAQLIQNGNQESIWNYFDNARSRRQSMEIHKRGGVESGFDIFVNVPDKEDVILSILELLRGTSLVNMHINEENREDIDGILQITFKNIKDRDTAKRLIEEKTSYQVTVK
ncbi:prephenate dehydrogenase [Streptococcus sp. DD13]|uniref:prephenate dehydrogenase n=1 Tax=Streptococcus sp. DD13 TaxID=1777881 RepID=UPI000797B62A|nr:prephenate dehydrogenase [Streptococcus sp. DD13]KXT79169.1 Prephenate dehydrogenase [Streptococcus sp. DD13]